MRCNKQALLLYAVTDRAWLRGHTLAEQVEQCLRGGATMLQLREKELENAAFLQEALEIRALCHAYSVPFLINDNLEVALACNADGVHIGQSDMQAARARALLGPDKILGVSAQTVEQALRAERDGADYLGVGTVFPTSTKPDADYVAKETLTAICAAVSIPVVAIGGIDEGNLLSLAGAGIDGVAVVSAIFAQPDIQRATERLKALSEEMVRS